jgi:flagellar FliJ protein
MKKFKFTLEGVRKLKEFKEKKAKIELGKIGQEIRKVEEQIIKSHSDLEESYEAQDKVASSGTEGRVIQFFPFFNMGKRAQIKELESNLGELKEKYQQQLVEVNNCRAESKLFSNLKDKQWDQFKKEQKKRLEREIEDLNLITISSRRAR